MSKRDHQKSCSSSSGSSKSTSASYSGRSDSYRRRSDDSEPGPPPTKVKNKTETLNKTVISMTASAYLFFLILAAHIDNVKGQQVIFSKEKLPFHSIRQIMNSRLINLEINRTINIILSKTDQTDFQS